MKYHGNKGLDFMNHTYTLHFNYGEWMKNCWFFMKNKGMNEITHGNDNPQRILDQGFMNVV